MKKIMIIASITAVTVATSTIAYRAIKKARIKVAFEKLDNLMNEEGDEEC